MNELKCNNSKLLTLTINKLRKQKKGNPGYYNNSQQNLRLCALAVKLHVVEYYNKTQQVR